MRERSRPPVATFGHMGPSMIQTGHAFPNGYSLLAGALAFAALVFAVPAGGAGVLALPASLAALVAGRRGLLRRRSVPWIGGRLGSWFGLVGGTVALVLALSSPWR